MACSPARLLSTVVARHYEDGVPLLLFSLAMLVLLAYWHFTGWYVHLAHDHVVLQNEARQVTRPRDQVWKVVSISGLVYQLVFQDHKSYLFVYSPAFPFHRDFGSNEAQAAAILHRIRGQDA